MHDIGSGLSVVSKNNNNKKCLNKVKNIVAKDKLQD